MIFKHYELVFEKNRYRDLIYNNSLGILLFSTRGGRTMFFEIETFSSFCSDVTIESSARLLSLLTDDAFDSAGMQLRYIAILFGCSSDALANRLHKCNLLL